MARTTVAEVKQIMDTALTDPQINAYISVSTSIVTDVFVNNTTLGDVRLEEIERWLTAHLIASTRERQTTEEWIGDVKIKYAGTFGEGLKSTTYGQMVLFLDSTGLIAKLSKKAVRILAIESFEE